MAAVRFVLLAALALHDEPSLEYVRTITGGAARSGCWLPLRVGLRAPSGFEGIVRASADAGFSVSRHVRVPAGGTSEILLPIVALYEDARVEVALHRGGRDITTRKLDERLEFLGPKELLLLVDPSWGSVDSLRAHELQPPDGRYRLRPFPSESSCWDEADGMGAFEAVDAVLMSQRRAREVSLSLWRSLGGAVWTDRPRIATPAVRFEAIDARVAPLARSDPWSELKRDAAMLFLVIYAFSLFVAGFVTWARRLGIRTLAGALVGTSALFVLGYAVLFPKGDLTVQVHQAIYQSSDGWAVANLHEPRSSQTRPREILFGRLAKPVRAAAPRTTSLEVHLTEDQGSVVRGWRPPDPAWFLTLEPSGPREGGAAADAPPPDAVRRYFARPEGFAVAFAVPETAVAPLAVQAHDLVETRLISAIKLERAR
ncbi:MAG: hypothetical protein HY716_04965 [Planctomycetes bacterium]|nr:hypothetical protein [Planctomycetota bacterium]